MADFEIIELAGEIPYREGLEIQMKHWKEVGKGGNSRILFLEHTPTITLGRRTNPDHLLYSQEEYKKRGIEVVKVDRGGSVTYHGPGQLVGYIITRVARHGGTHNLVTKTMQMLEQSIVQLGIEAQKNEEFPGIWTTTQPPKKLAAIGMQIKAGTSLHGFAVNVNLELEPFSMIVPCGLPEPVSTLSIELKRRVSIEEVKENIIQNLSVFKT